MGAMYQTDFAGALYNCMLSFYYLLPRFGISEKLVGRRVEHFMHLFASGYPPYETCSSLLG